MKTLKLRVLPTQAGFRLDQALAELATGYSKSFLRKLIIAGAVYLGGKRVMVASRGVRAGDLIEVHIREDAAHVKQAQSFKRDWMQEDWAQRVIFQDDDLIAINKPSGIPVQPTLDQARGNLQDVVKRFFKIDYLAMHHRIDVDTSGVIVFSKASRANKGLTDQFRDHTLQKVYVAITEKRAGGAVPSKFQVKNNLGVVAKFGKRKKFGSVRSGGDPAETTFEILDSDPSKRHFLVRALPKTGRTHQIRVHLSESGLPIVGDSLYGGPEHPERFFLHAERLDLKHPVTGQDLTLQAPWPKEFTQCLRSLKIPF